MKSERETLVLDIGELRAQIEQLEAIVAQQAQEIEAQRAKIEHLNQAQARWADIYAICLIDGDGYIFDKVCRR
jgi:flagellar biosynthesis chaperone FliJ